jgi:chromosome segregation protein
VDEEIAGLSSTIADLAADAHRHEKTIVALDAQLGRIDENRERLSRRSDLIRNEAARSQEQRRALEDRERDAREEIIRKQVERSDAEGLLAEGQRELQSARGVVDQVGREVADARAAHAGLLERASALRAEVGRLEEALAELMARASARREESVQNLARQASLRQAIADGERQLDEDVSALESLRVAVREGDEALAALRAAAEGQEGEIRSARSALDELRSEVAELDLSRVTAESDLGHLAAICLESVEARLEDVLAEVEAAERAGQIAPAPSTAESGDGEEPEEEVEAAPAPEATPAKSLPSTPEEAIAALKARIERLGPVNMMAIEQFDELEGRHVFLTAQRQDLRESIAATGEAIRRIDETSKERFRQAFAVINDNFHDTFSVLFGGGRAGLALLDESDVLESGIEIVAQPPGKRLQNVQLLSGGEKALTAIALMFAIFRYKPSPFCVLDEIDAPLDDANIGRFVEILKQMQDQTQFIIITHSRKTMEIADRLYGVTMEEPGVSKLISVRLN